MRVIQVKVKPNLHRSGLNEVEHGLWLARVKSPPTDGRANAELVTLIADHFGCSKSSVRIKSGSSARLKLVQIDR